MEPRFQEHFVDAMVIPHRSAPYAKLRAAVDLPPPAPGARPAGGRPAGRRWRPPADEAARHSR